MYGHVSMYVCLVSMYVSHVSMYVCHVSMCVSHVSMYVSHVSMYVCHVSMYVSHVSMYVSHVSMYVSHVSISTTERERVMSQFPRQKESETNFRGFMLSFWRVSLGVTSNFLTRDGPVELSHVSISTTFEIET